LVGAIPAVAMVAGAADASRSRLRPCLLQFLPGEKASAFGPREICVVFRVVGDAEAALGRPDAQQQSSPGRRPLLRNWTAMPDRPGLKWLEVVELLAAKDLRLSHAARRDSAETSA